MPGFTLKESLLRHSAGGADATQDQVEVIKLLEVSLNGYEEFHVQVLP